MEIYEKGEEEKEVWEGGRQINGELMELSSYMSKKRKKKDH